MVAGSEWGRVRALVSDVGDHVDDAGPSVPVEVLGFNGTPEAGDRVAVVENEARAREITEYRERQKRERTAARLGAGRGTLADMMSALKAGGSAKELPLVIKADVQGSARGDHRRPRQGRQRGGEGPRHPFGRRRHHRIGYHARRGIGRGRHRLQRACP